MDPADAKEQTPPQAANVAPEPVKPPRIPDYDLLRRIGRGSYGEVWLARGVTGAYRAVKIVYRQSFDHDRPFEREFSGILKFEPISRKHQSQVDILHVGRGEGYFYYVMELADDQFSGQQIQPDTYAPRTLKSEAFQRGKLPFEDCVQIGLALTTALEHLHSNCLVHRDVKPSNTIFINGVPKLADIGLVTGVDATKSFVGTEGFAPPEGAGTAQADLYSLGKVLYEIATGRDRQDYPELPTLLDALPDREALLELNAVIAKACRHDPRDRYVSAQAMHDELQLLQSGKSLARLRTMERTAAKLKRASVTIAVVSVLATAAWVYQARQTQRMTKLAVENLALAREAQTNAADLRLSVLIARENLYASDINQAQKALAADNLRQARDLLEKQIPKPSEPDLRGFEWRYLWQQCQSGELFNLPGHKGIVTCVGISPDGRLVATGSYDTGTEIWDLASRRVIATLNDHTAHVNSVSFSPNGDLLATGSAAAVWLWDAKTFKLLRTLPDAVLKATFSPDGHYLLTCQTNGLMLWDTSTWDVVKTAELAHMWKSALGDLDNVEIGIAFTPKSRQIAAPVDDGVKLLSVPDLRELSLLRAPMPLARFAAFSPDGRTVATPSLSHDLKLWDILTRKGVRLFRGHSDGVLAAAFSADGKRLISCGSDQTVRLWNVASGELVHTFRGHTDGVFDLAFLPKTNLFASVSIDGGIKVWGVSAYERRNPDLDDMVPFAFGSDGNLMAFDTNNSLIAIEPETLQTTSVQQFRGRNGLGPIKLLSSPDNLSSDGYTAALPIESESNSQVTCELWDLGHRRFIGSTDSIGPPVVFAANRQLLATRTSNQTVTIWRLPQASRKFDLSNSVRPIAFSSDGTMLATFSKANEIDVWKLEANRGSRLTSLRRFYGFNGGAAFSLDGGTLAVAQGDGSVGLWGIPSGREVATLIGHKRKVQALSFSVDGRTLASFGEDYTLRLWHAATGRELIAVQLPMDDSEFRHFRLGFSADGGTLMASTYVAKGAALTRVWRAPSFAEIALAEGKDYTALADGPATWHAVGRALEKQNRAVEAVQAFSEVIRQSGGEAHFEALRKTALLHRSKLFKRLGRYSEAAKDNLTALDLPEHDPRTPPTAIDLSLYFNGTLDWNSLYLSIPPDPFLTDLPRGLQTLPVIPGVQLDVRGVVQLNNGAEFPGFPHAVEGIAVRQKCRCLHLLQATHSSEDEGKQVGVYAVRFADGTQEEIPIVYGRDVRDWTPNASDPADLQGAKLAWTGQDGHRVYMTTWQNPRPDVEIASLDFISKLTKCGPFLIAITAE